MSIQNSLNSITGAVAGAVVAGKHAQTKKAEAEAAKVKEAEAAKLTAAKEAEQGDLAKSQYHEAKADVTKLEGQSAEAGKALEDANTAVAALEGKKPGGKGNTKAAIAEKQKKALTEQEAAQRAFDELQDRIEAKKAIMSRTEKIMKRTGTWGGVK